MGARALAGFIASAALLAAVPGAGAAVNPRPATVPALQEWDGGEGTFSLRSRSRILVDSRDTGRLLSEARLLADDLQRLTGRRLRVVVRRRTRSRRPTRVRPGDIHLRLGSRDERLGGEGYKLRIGRYARIFARTDTGAFYGTRTLLQLMRASGDERSLPRGRARDWPRHPERGLMIDNGRKYFTPDWIERHIRELAYLKMNRLHLHLSDNQGFRIESDSHPEIVSSPHLTKREVRRLLRVARRHHVTVVPEIDMPGHMEAALRNHPELQLRNAAGMPSPDKLDVTLPAARRFARELIEEYLDLFDGPFWHGGADEYFFPVPEEAGYALHPQLEAYAKEQYGPSAVGKDAVLGFIEYMRSIVEARGRTLRVWHDGLEGGSAVRISPHVVVEWWSNHAGPPPQQLLEQGHRVLNAGWFPTYYVNGGLGTVRPDMRTAYESWEVNEFYGPFVANETLAVPPHRVPEDEEGVTGSLLHVWNDDPEAATEEEIEAGIAPRLRVLAQKTWRSPPLTPAYDEFRRRTEAVGSAP